MMGSEEGEKNIAIIAIIKIKIVHNYEAKRIYKG